MKTVAKITLAAALLATQVSVWADDAHHPEKAGAAKPATEMPATTPDSGGKGKGMGMMHDHMKLMMEQMEKIRQTKDPMEKDKLIDEHMQEMASHMKMMQGMMGGGMMHGSSTDMASMMEQRMKMMEQRMEQMQQKMDQMSSKK